MADKFPKIATSTGAPPMASGDCIKHGGKWVISPAPRTFTAEEVEGLLRALQAALPQIPCYHSPKHGGGCIFCGITHPEHAAVCRMTKWQQIADAWDAKLSAPGGKS